MDASDEILNRHHVVVVGAGFGGLETVHRLAGAPVRITTRPAPVQSIKRPSILHAGGYWLMWGLRVSMPKRSMWRVAQFDTLRLRPIKIAARVVEMKTMIRVHLPTSCPVQDILRFALGRIPRLVTWQAGLERPEYSQSSLQPQTLPAPNSGSKPEPTRRIGIPGLIGKNNVVLDGNVLHGIVRLRAAAHRG
jgi:hypothetical protein